jgi:hypothetical protein
LTTPSPIVVNRKVRNRLPQLRDVLTGLSVGARVKHLRQSLGKTPGKIRAARTLVAAFLLITFFVGFATAVARVGVIHRIKTRSEPLSADLIEVYRRLAYADATVAAEFLASTETEVNDSRLLYTADLEQATLSLAHAVTLAGEPSLRTRRLGEISQQVITYNGLVEGARTKRSLAATTRDDLRQASEVTRSAILRQFDTGEDLRRASEVMRSTILRLCETLLREESENLDAQYRQARSWPTATLTLGLITLALLAFLQRFLFRRTRRVLNLGMVLATAAVVGASLWWMAALWTSSSHLEAARRHSQAVTDALGEAQIAASQARSSELLLQVPNSGASEQNFVDKMRVLFRTEGGDAGSGGALGVAGQLAESTSERQNVASAVNEAQAWMNAHGRNPVEATRAFGALDKALTNAVRLHDTAFKQEIDRSTDALFGFAVGTSGLGVAAAVAATLGFTLRLKEYQY